MRQHRLQAASARPNESSFFTTPRSRARTSPNVSLSDIPFLQLSNSSRLTINSNFEYENRFVGSRAYRACAVSSRKSKEEEEEEEKNVAD